MKKLINFFARNSLLVNLITWGIIIGSIFLASGIKQDLFPESDSDAMLISVAYPGASARDVELNVTRPLEDKLKTISGIDKYNSTSVENNCRIFVRIDENLKNTQKVKDEIRRKMTSISGLPGEVEDIDVKDLSPEYISVYEIGLYLEKDSQLTEEDLYLYADRLERELLKLSNVSDVTIEGDREKEVKISVDPKKMSDYKISLADITSSIQSRNVREAGGTIESVTGTHDIVSIGQFDDPMDVKDVIIRSNFEQEQVTVKDIADVEYGFTDETVLSRINGNKGVYIKVKKKAESDIVKTAQEVKQFVQDVKKELPAGLEIISISDESQTITSLMKVVKSNAFLGFCLVFILLIIFLRNFKVSFWVAFGIPTSTFMTLAIMSSLDFTLNIMTLGTIAMLLGIMVDDGIVISESIVKYKANGYNSIDAAYYGLKEVAAPVFVSVFTTIVAFLPLLTIKGMMGKFVFVLPIVVLITLAVSFIEATIMLPAHLVLGKNKKPKKTDKPEKKNWFNQLENAYKKSLKGILKFRYLVVLFFILIFIFIIFISGNSLKKFRLMNNSVSDSFQVSLTLDEKLGGTIYETAAYVDTIEKEIEKNLTSNELLSIQSSVGHSQSSPMSLTGSHTNEAIITVNLVPETERKRKAGAIVKELKNILNTKNYRDFTEMTVKTVVRGPDAGSAVDLKLLSTNDNEAVKFMNEIKAYLNNIEGIINVKDNIEEARSELTLKFDYKKMAMLNVNVQTVAKTVRTAYYGTVATTLIQNSQELDFRVLVSEKNEIARNEKYLLNLLVSNNSGKLVKLKDFAYIKYNKSVYSIIHEDGYRVFEITADISLESNNFSQPPAGSGEMSGDPGPQNNHKLTSLQINRMIQNAFADKIKQNSYVDMKIGGEAEKSMEALSGLGIAFLMAVLLIYFTMVILFKNFSQPILVMLSIPFGIIGAIIAFNLHNMAIDFFGIVGFIGLSGIVVNDCIVIIDFLNKHFKKADTSDKASIINQISEGAKERLRAIVLTTVTTSAGLIPTVYGFGGSSPFVTPIALAIAYGLLFATLVTLFFIPSIYLIRLDMIEFFNKIKLRAKRILARGNA
ncbi:MAG: efflux RND transporter permease subunit [Spirochaetes bacterium]|nr:efflux RND transporter permease subunit [Spirochaetota bacterium]